MSAEAGVLAGGVRIVIGMTLIGLVDNTVRFAAAEIGLWQFHFIRALMALPLILIVAHRAGQRLAPRNWRGALLRTGAIVVSMMLYFSALPILPAAVVGAGLFTAPVWVLLIAAAIYRERIGPRRLGAVAAAFTGALLVLRPDPAALDIAGLAPLAAGAFYALALTWTWRLCREEAALTLLFLFFSGMGLAGLAGCVALALAPAGPATLAAAPFFFAPWGDWVAVAPWIALQAGGSLIAVWFMTTGYQMAETSRLIVFDYAFLISASIFGFLFWEDRLDLLTIGGMILIAGAGVFAARAGRAPAPSAPSAPT